MEENKNKNNENNEEIKKNILSESGILLFIGCLFLGILFDTLFCWKILGISYPLFVMAFYGVFIWNARKTIYLKLDFAWALTVPIILLSFTYLFYSNVILAFFNFLGIPVLILMQTTLLLKKNRHEWHSIGFIRDIFHSMFVKTVTNVPRPLKIFEGVSFKKYKNPKIAVTGKVVAGLILSVPLVIVLIMLLSSADQVFMLYTQNIVNLFDNVNTAQLISRIFVILLVSLIFYSYFWSLFSSRSEQVLEEVKKAPKIFDGVVLLTILVMVNLLYIFFVVIQFAYLFGGPVSALPQNLSHSEYARKGFFELIAVTIINLNLLLVSFNMTKEVNKILGRALQGLNSLLVVCTGIMLYSAHFRMSLYEQAYGYTYLRIFTHAFMICIFLLLAASLYKVWKQNFSIAKAYILITITAYVVLNYVNVDTIIAQKNFERYQATKQIDVSYLEMLSYDAVPWLVQLMDDKNYEVSVQAKNNLHFKRNELVENAGWQSFNISRYNALKKLLPLKLSYQEIRTNNTID